jgi:hypothetical protein
MRELKVVGLHTDGKRIILETGAGSDGKVGEKYFLRVDDRLRAAIRGDRAGSGQTRIDVEVKGVLRPKDIQSRIRAGASVEQVAATTGVDIERIQRFANPVLLERSRAAELACAAHPVLADGPSVMTLLETVSGSLVARGLDPQATTWDAWRNEDGRWTVEVGWKAGRSENAAHFRYTPGAHGGIVTTLDDTASELIDPGFSRPLRPVTPLAQLDFGQSSPAAEVKVPETPQPACSVEQQPEEAKPVRPRNARPAVPGWEDVLLSIRSNGH